jgi:hypothetical protein
MFGIGAYLAMGYKLIAAHVKWFILFVLCSTIIYQCNSIRSLESDLVTAQSAVEREKLNVADCERVLDKEKDDCRIQLEYCESQRPLEIKPGPVNPSIIDELYYGKKRKK